MQDTNLDTIRGRRNMKKMLFLMLFLICVLPLLSLAEQNPAPKGFRNFAWGTPPTKNLKKAVGPVDGVTMYVPKDANKLVPLHNISVVEEAYSFSHGKFYQGEAWIDGQENFDKIKAALTKQYGQPTSSSSGQSLYKWKWPNSKIEVHLYYQAKFSRASVRYVNNNY